MSWCCCCFRTGTGAKIGALDRKITLLVIGLDDAGKTTAIKSLTGAKPGPELESVTPTVGFSRSECKYKGFRVTFYDLGGSKAFRGIWPKYFHEAHGFVFVVDGGAKEAKMTEAKEAFRDALRHDKVRGKPILVLCNKSDLEQAADETQIVDLLNVERLVNEARCPTRVETCVANKGQGLRVGYKWLTKSVIANLADLGPRVEADVNLETQLEEKRKKELIKRIEERRKRLELEEEQEDDNVDRGFIPLSELKNNWMEAEKEKKEKAGSSSNNNNIIINNNDSNEETPAKSNGKVQSTGVQQQHRLLGSLPDLKPESGLTTASTIEMQCQGQEVFIEDEEDEGHFSPPRTQLDLEPISQPKKKKNLLQLRRLNNNKTAPGGQNGGRYAAPGARNGSVESMRDSQVIRAYT